MSESPAMQLRDDLISMRRDLVRADIGDDGTTLTVTVRPLSSAYWHWWLQLFDIKPDTVTYQGTGATAHGHRRGVTVPLIGLGAALVEADTDREVAV